MKMQKWGLAAPATASALSIASHALLPGVYWFWQAIWTSALRAGLWGALGASALAGGGMVTDWLRVKSLTGLETTSSGNGSPAGQPDRRTEAFAWVAKLEALVARLGKAQGSSSRKDGQTSGEAPKLTWLLSKDFRAGRRAARELAAQVPPELQGDAKAEWHANNGARLGGRAIGYGLFGLAGLDLATIAFVLVAPIHWYVGFAITKSAVIGGALLAMATSAGRAQREIEAAATLEAAWQSGDGSPPAWEQLEESEKAALKAWAKTRLKPPAEGSTLLEKLSGRYAKLVTKTPEDAAQLQGLMRTLTRGAEP
ncbi:MAG: hypothetical protein IPG96_02110 [Proteobacteria bacterium]|nr:hypothetical protein [Pseudomonadota bacterium]